MMQTQTQQMYKYTDSVIRRMNRQFVEIFARSTRLIRQDELNVMRGAKKMYSELDAIVKESYMEIAEKAYKNAYAMVLPMKKKKSGISAAWLLAFLTAFDPVTGYVFNNEVKRKRDRFAESVIAQRRRSDIIRARDLFARQAAQYALEVTDKATIKAYEDAGIKKVRWKTEGDDKVCRECKEMNNRVYDVDKIPDKPHINCRCIVVPVIDKK